MIPPGYASVFLVTKGVILNLVSRLQLFQDEPDREKSWSPAHLGPLLPSQISGLVSYWARSSPRLHWFLKKSNGKWIKWGVQNLKLLLLRYNGQRLYSCSELEQRESCKTLRQGRRKLLPEANWYFFPQCFDAVASHKKQEFKHKRSNPINVSDKSVISIETPSFVPKVPYY